MLGISFAVDEGVIDVEPDVEAVENIMLVLLVLSPTDPYGGAVFDVPVIPIIVWNTPVPIENVPLSLLQSHFPDA